MEYCRHSDSLSSAQKSEKVTHVQTCKILSSEAIIEKFFSLKFHFYVLIGFIRSKIKTERYKAPEKLIFQDKV